MARAPSALPSRRVNPLRADRIPGNGQPPPLDGQPDHLVRIEALLKGLQHQLDIQLQRIADLQAQLDRAISDRPLSSKN